MVSLGHIFRAHTKKLSFIAGFALAIVGLMGAAGVGVGHVSATGSKDCDSNAIIYCGFTDGSARDFINKASAGNSGGSTNHHDLQAIYAKYGLEPADYDKFVTDARPGTAYKDGRIVVDGQVVATGAKSIGRLASYQGSGYFTTRIGGTTYYGNTNDKAFASNGIPVMVLFNNKGVMQFAVLSSCGNPEFGITTAPSYSCNELHATPVSGKPSTYTFTTDASAANNATVSKVVYDFGDGTTKEVKGADSPSVPVTHTYAKGGSFTAKVTVYVNLPGNQTVTVTSATCQKVINIPFFECLELTGAFIDKDKMQISLTAKASFGGGATFTSADFDFGDGKSQKGVQPNGTTATVTHTYANPGTFNATAVLHFTANGTAVTAPTCAAVVTPTTPPTPECKPGVPIGSPECLPPTPPSPPELPKTGAGNTIAMFAAVVIAGFLVYRQLVFRKHRVAFLAAEQGTSPLPLADPLSDHPLDGTPLATKRRIGRLGLHHKRRL